MKRSSSASLRSSSPNSRVDADSTGLKYFVASLASCVLPSVASAKPRMTACAASRVSGSKVLKSWSSSTTEAVVSAGSVAPEGILSPVAEPCWRST